MERRSDSASAHLVDRCGRTVVELRVEGGKHQGAVGEAGAETMERAVRLATELGVPFVAWLDTAGADVQSDCRQGLSGGIGCPPVRGAAALCSFTCSSDPGCAGAPR